MFDIIGAVLQGKDLLEDVAHGKQRYARQIKFFRDENKKLGIAFFDDNTVYGEYWIGNIAVPIKYESQFKASGLKLEVKYQLELLDIATFAADSQILSTPVISKKLVKNIFAAMDD